MTTASLAAVFAMSCVSASAQWIHYPTPGIPRNADGSPNLAAPAPKTADGKPDFSGLWDTEKNRPCPPGGCPDLEVSQQFMNYGWGLKGGLPYQPWAAELTRARSEQNGKDDPGTQCLPIGFLRLLTDGMYRKIVQLPSLLLILNERNTTYRQIFMDGRPLPVIRTRHGMDTRPRNGMAMRWSSRPTAFGTASGWIATAVRLQPAPR